MKIFVGKLLYAVVSVYITALVSAGYSGEYHTFLVVATMGVCIIMMPSRWEKGERKSKTHDETEQREDFYKNTGRCHPAMPCIFVYKNKKPRKNPRQMAENLLTNGAGCDMMVLHSVIICPHVAILIHEEIVSQNMAVVKRKVEKIPILTTDPGVL